MPCAGLERVILYIRYQSSQNNCHFDADLLALALSVTHTQYFDANFTENVRAATTSANKVRAFCDGWQNFSNETISLVRKKADEHGDAALCRDIDNAVINVLKEKPRSQLEVDERRRFLDQHWDALKDDVNAMERLHQEVSESIHDRVG